MRAELRELAAHKRLEKGSSAHAPVPDAEAGEEDGDEGLSPWTPEERVRMYREMAEQKEEQERSKAHMNPKKRCVCHVPPSPCCMERATRVARCRRGWVVSGANSLWNPKFCVGSPCAAPHPTDTLTPHHHRHYFHTRLA
jgi:hypothetical protein